MPLLVTSASGANGNGHGALLAFDRDGRPLGVFSEDSRIADPRGLAAEPEQQLLFLNSADRVLALDCNGKVVRDTGAIAGLNPGGGIFGRAAMLHSPRSGECPGRAWLPACRAMRRPAGRAKPT